MNANPTVTSGPWESVDRWKVMALPPGNDDYHPAYEGPEEIARVVAARCKRQGWNVILQQAQERIQTQWGFRI